MNTKEFKAHPLLPGGQLQTLAGYFLSPPPAVAADEFIYVALPDGDKIELVINNPKGPVTATLYLLHGLGGDSDSGYKLRLTKKLLPLGYRIIRHNHRGNGVHGNEAKGMYHSGSAVDVLECLKEIARRYPENPLGIIGFSLSGTIVLNLLAWYAKELEDLGLLKAAMSVCAPIDLEESSRALSQLRNKHYDLFFAKTAIEQFHRRRFISDDQAKTYLHRPSLRKIDEHVTAPYGGFRDASHYYDECSPKHTLSQISIDTLILAAADDPIVPAQSVLKAPIQHPVKLRMETSGGHMGFLGRHLTTHGDYRWLDTFVENWAQSKFKAVQ
ncbi:MAG: alpha/beta fold hydrolase [Chitinophagaceae bacterium]|nr:alpha/beta fold hydrolase [Oligoflexus sp.]